MILLPSFISQNLLITDYLWCGLFRCYMVYVYIEDSPFQLKSEEGCTDFYDDIKIYRDKFYASGKLSLVFLFHVCSRRDMPSITISVLVILWFTQN